MRALHTKKPELVDQIICEAASIKTVADLQRYAKECKSPPISKLFEGAVHFFSVDCRRPEGGKDWKEIKKRKALGLRFKLTPEIQITVEICEAIASWIMSPQYGRKVAGTASDDMISALACGIDLPIQYAFDLLNQIVNNLRGESEKPSE